MKRSGWAASEGVFSICEMPPSPWQPTHSSAFSLPAAMSAALAGEPHAIAAASTIPTSAFACELLCSHTPNNRGCGHPFPDNRSP